MNSREIVRRLRAWDAGIPIERYSTLHHAIVGDADTLVVAFVRMAGETRPWGIAYGHPGKRPSIVTVPDARVRDDVAAIAATFGRTLLKHLQTPGYATDAPSDDAAPRPLRQVWLPNDSHREMLHHLAFAYATTSYGDGDRAVLNAFGRACGWLFRESERAGQQHVVVASRVLADAYVFPSDDIRQAHLGYLLAWLTTPGQRDERIAAASDAERQSVSVTLDPSTDRDVLAAHVDRYNDARRNGRAQERKRAAAQIGAVLEGELLHRFDLTVQGRQVLQADPRQPNSHLDSLVRGALREQWRQSLEAEFKAALGEKHFFASVDTDWHPAAAAERYFTYEASAEKVERTLCHGDAELLAEVVERGDGFVGCVTSVSDEGLGKTTVPVWQVHASDLVNPRLRERSKVCLVGAMRRVAEIRRISPHPDGGLALELVITNLKTKISGASGILGVAPNDIRWVGCRVAFVATSGDTFASRRAQLVWGRGGPGAWLTHSRPARRAAAPPAADDADGAVPVSGLA